MDVDDPVVAVLPIHLSNSLVPNLQLHQFPLLFRPLQVPPSAAESGKRIRARHKPRTGRIEVHVPVDTRKEVWNPERGIEFGAARAEGDLQGSTSDKKDKGKYREGEEPRLGEIRLSSERILERGAYMLGIVKDGHLHLHPITQTHQLRPTLTYLDVLSQKTRRSRGAGADGDSDSDDGPPPDPDEPTPAVTVVKKDKKPATAAREIQVTAKKTSEDKAGTQQFQGGMSQVRRDMLMMLRNEMEEPWEDLEYCDGEHPDSAEAFESVFSKSSGNLVCTKMELVHALKQIGNS